MANEETPEQRAARMVREAAERAAAAKKAEAQRVLDNLFPRNPKK